MSRAPRTPATACSGHGVPEVLGVPEVFGVTEVGRCIYIDTVARRAAVKPHVCMTCPAHLGSPSTADTPSKVASNHHPFGRQFEGQFWEVPVDASGYCVAVRGFESESVLVEVLRYIALHITWPFACFLHVGCPGHDHKERTAWCCLSFACVGS